MPRVLSTKKLAKNQKELLLNSGIGLVEYDAIRIEFENFEINTSHIKNAIFSSKNAVKAVENKPLEIENCFCVGTKTSALLKSKGYKILEVAENASDLGKLIADAYSEENFTFFCGNIRRVELPELLKKNKVKFEEIQVYKTILNYQKIDGGFNGILFFSPSGVESFRELNNWKTTAFCIGKTTAAETEKYNFKTVVSNSASVESVIAKTVKTLKKLNLK
ncbi:uroporphyrinogen-III synthase [Gramella sp. AN32]|uniref:Uroporphyrinogen-III synthase n=1 Tax=Christiangramia antarctica TaxID=2058158 RepID=A0ABW5X0C8_9FLAO|nr:uroporphyrinogen-III synthase [Gramella sp. AN32]MCM4155079.1 uroporphyrinogen-III synthase [Gramella sp. AN32]